MTISTQQVNPIHSSHVLNHPNPPVNDALASEPLSEAKISEAELFQNDADLSQNGAVFSQNGMVQFQLPDELAQVFRAGAGDELNEFASYALTRFLLREQWVELEDCPLLPFMIHMTHDVVDYQLAPDPSAAVAQAEAMGDETALQVELDLGLNLDVFEE